MKTLLAEFKPNPLGKSFFIPVQVTNAGEIFTADAQPINQEQDEDNEQELGEEEKAAAWFESEAQKQRWQDEQEFPSSLNNYQIFKHTI